MGPSQGRISLHSAAVKYPSDTHQHHIAAGGVHKCTFMGVLHVLVHLIRRSGDGTFVNRTEGQRRVFVRRGGAEVTGRWKGLGRAEGVSAIEGGGVMGGGCNSV